jgi:undecaprenyl-diphosphatase
MLRGPIELQTRVFLSTVYSSTMLNAVLLGIVQGLTEFLPVSSSGHIELAKYLLGEDSVGKTSLLMTVVLHFATALSTIVVFRTEVAKIVQGLFQSTKSDEFQFSMKILVSMIPAVIVGVSLEGPIESLFDKNLMLVGWMLVVTGVLLLLADRAKHTDKKVSFSSAAIIGIAQAIAILPGISRSGATISTSVLLGVDRREAARFSFLMVVPLIFGKMGKDLLSGELGVGSDVLWPLAVGFGSAFVTGIFACTWMIKLVQKSKLSYFSVYCFILAGIAIFEAGRISQTAN